VDEINKLAISTEDAKGAVVGVDKIDGCLDDAAKCGTELEARSNRNDR